MDNENTHDNRKKVLTDEQETLLDLYLSKLDQYIEGLKESEKIQAQIETLHLKKIITK